MYLQQITSPFGCLRTAIDNQESMIKQNDAKDAKEQTDGDHRFSKEEKNLEVRFDRFAKNLY